MTSRFKPGDIVIGNDIAETNYVVTTRYTIWTVSEADEIMMTIGYPISTVHGYSVRTEAFFLYEDFPEDDKKHLKKRAYEI